MKTGALVVAAGRGARARRSDVSTPKQYVSIAGIPVLARSLAQFLSHSAIDFVLPVIHASDQSIFQSLVSSLPDFFDRDPAWSNSFLTKLLPPISGGESRQQSVLNGLRSFANHKPDFVLIHDGVRPFVSHELIQSGLTALETHPAMVPVLPVVDTVKQVEGDLVTATHDRSRFFLAQTPQGFGFEAILSAHETAAETKDTLFTDDASIAEWAGLEVAVIPGEADNIKITVAADFEKGAQILGKSGEGLGGMVRVGQGFDVHAFEPGDYVTLCGVEIPFDQKLKGHSDADVGLHALSDALYGAIGAGDIGHHFPPTDPQWKGAASHIFLEHAMQLVAEKGGVVSNVDLTLICESPKIGPHRAAMINAVASITGIETDCISIKATTSERLGFTGRGEGIAAMATATVMMR